MKTFIVALIVILFADLILALLMLNMNTPVNREEDDKEQLEYLENLRKTKEEKNEQRRKHKENKLSELRQENGGSCQRED